MTTSAATRVEPHLDFRLSPWSAFKFDRDDIARLCDTASSYTGTAVDLSIYFSNGNSISSEDPDVCLGDTNNLTSLISNVYIKSSNYKAEGGSRTISIDLKTVNLLSVVDVRGSGPRSASVVLRSEIEQILSSNKMWYSFIHFSTLVQSLGIGALSLILYEYLFQEMSRPKDIGVQIILGVFSSIVVMIPVPLLIFYFFPRSSIEIGLGQRKAAHRRRIGSFIVFTVLVGLLIGISGNFLTDKLKENVDAVKSGPAK